MKGFKYQKETCVARNTKLKKKSSHLSSITTTQDTTIKNPFLFEVFRTASPTSLISIIVKHLLYFYTRREIFLLQNYKGKFKNLLLMPGLECSWYKRRWFQQTLHGWAEAWRWVLGYFTDNYQAYGKFRNLLKWPAITLMMLIPKSMQGRNDKTCYYGKVDLARDYTYYNRSLLLILNSLKLCFKNI